MKILGTGLSGLVGSRIVELLKSKFQFEDLSLDSGVNITNRETVLQKISTSSASIVLHLAAKTNVDECETEKHLGDKSSAWQVNVEGTRNIIDACIKSGKKIIYVSTDFVFDGDKPVGEAYDEQDLPKPVNWYARTKFEGERVVQQSAVKEWIIIRLAYPYRAKSDREDFVRTIITRLQDGGKILMVSDHHMNPTFIDDIAIVLDVLVEKKQKGIFHVVGSECITPYEAGVRIAQVFSLNASLVTATTRWKFFKNRAPRPFNLCSTGDKIRKLGVRMRGFGDGLEEIRRQMKNG